MEKIDSITWLAHGSTLLQISGQCFFIDPVFIPSLCFLYKKNVEIIPESLPQPTAILLTSTAKDHFHVSSYKFFSNKVPLFTPGDAEKTVGKFLPNPVHKMQTWETLEVGPVKITSVPTGLKNILGHTTSQGYLIQSEEKNILIMGDTVYGPHFKDIAERFSVDELILPITENKNLWPLEKNRLTFKDVLKIAEETKDKFKKITPIAWRGFSFSPKETTTIETLQKALAEKPDLGAIISLVKPGETL